MTTDIYTNLFKINKPLAEQGDANAQELLASLYLTDPSEVKDYAEAFRWRKLAAEQGSANAQYNLSIMFDKGDGVLQDSAESLDGAS